MTLTGDAVLSNCHSATSSANLIRIRPGLKSGLRGHKSATKCTDHAVSFQISLSSKKMCKCYHLRMSQQLVPIPSHMNTLAEFSVSTLLSHLCLDLPCSILNSNFQTKCLHVFHVCSKTATQKRRKYTMYYNNIY